MGGIVGSRTPKNWKQGAAESRECPWISERECAGLVVWAATPIALKTARGIELRPGALDKIGYIAVAGDTADELWCLQNGDGGASITFQ